METTTVIILAPVALALIGSAFSLFLSIRLSKRMEVFFKGKKAQDLEEFISRHEKELNELTRDMKELCAFAEKVNSVASLSIKRIGIVRYNPFSDLGGNNSFSLALLNSEKSGVIITHLHMRDASRTYLKEIAKGKSTGAQLTEEEENAITEAKIANIKTHF